MPLKRNVESVTATDAYNRNVSVMPSLIVVVVVVVVVVRTGMGVNS